MRNPFQYQTFSAEKEDRSKRMTYGSSNDAKEAQAPRGLAELQVDLRQMVNNSAISDVVFVCSDGKRVHASRTLLAGMSEVLKNMLFNGMAETKIFEIELPEISSPSLLSVFEFLYTGALLDYHPQRWTATCELMLASRFFLLPKLEMIIRQFLDKQTFDVAGDLTKAATLLTEAMGFVGLCDEKDGFLVELVTILTSTWSNTKVSQNLSEDAFHYLLVNSKGNSLDDRSLSLREYQRFKLVMYWCICKSNLGSWAPQIFVHLSSEFDKRALSNVFGGGESLLEDAARLLNAWNWCQLDDASKNSLVRLISSIDWRRIHPKLLAEVVEPLKILSATKILNAFRFHALQRPVLLSSLPEYVWDHGEFCKTLENSHVIQRAARKIGLAVLKVLSFHCFTYYMKDAAKQLTNTSMRLLSPY